MRTLLAITAGSILLASTGAFGQSLSERYKHVMQKRMAAQANNTSKAQMLGTLLYTDMTVEFQETPARDVFDFLQTTLGINILPRYIDDRGAFSGIDPETPITLNVKDQSALNVLELVLAQCEDIDPCTWQLRDGFVEVGTKERLSAPAAREIRYYPIRDLIFEPPRFNNAPELDLDAALNQGGNFGGGGGGGGFGGGGGGGFGGGGGGSGGGGGGGVGGGSLFGDIGEEPERTSELERAQQVIDIIVELVEPESWVQNGGDAASIRYFQGTLIVRAPDYIQRQIGGYPFAIRPTNRVVSAGSGSRYVTFTGGLSNVTNADFRTVPVGGAAGNSTGGSGSDGASGASGESTGGAKSPKSPKSND